MLWVSQLQEADVSQENARGRLWEHVPGAGLGNVLSRGKAGKTQIGWWKSNVRVVVKMEAVTSGLKGSLRGKVGRGSHQSLL